MSYTRVIPRDLFNEANLLKCYGQLELMIDKLNIPGVAIEYDGEAFDVQQNPTDGALSLFNISLLKGEEGYPYLNSRSLYFFRPLNSREPWPLYTHIPDENDDWQEVAVFNADGGLSAEFFAFLKG